jgi:hypothetical protein
MNPPLQQLRDILYAGVAPDIMMAERARELHRVIGQHAIQINRAGYGDLFQTMQNAAVGEVTLLLTRLFERSGRYPVRSIPAATDVLRTNASTLVPEEPAAALADFARVGIPTLTLERLDGEAYTRALAALLAQACPKASDSEGVGLSAALSSIRTSRDKTFAHNEAIDRTTLRTAAWADTERLLDFAKNVHAGIAMAYFGSVWMDDAGTFLASSDAAKAARQLDRLLRTAGVVVPVALEETPGP